MIRACVCVYSEAGEKIAGGIKSDLRGLVYTYIWYGIEHERTRSVIRARWHVCSEAGEKIKKVSKKEYVNA